VRENNAHAISTTSSVMLLVVETEIVSDRGTL